MLLVIGAIYARPVYSTGAASVQAPLSPGSAAPGSSGPDDSPASVSPGATPGPSVTGPGNTSGWIQGDSARYGPSLSPSPPGPSDGPLPSPSVPPALGALTVSPAKVDLANYGTTASLEVTGGGALRWTASPSDPALAVTPSSGTTNGDGSSTPVTVTLHRATTPSGDSRIAFRTADGREWGVLVHWRAPGQVTTSTTGQDLGYFGSTGTFQVRASGGDLNWTASSQDPAVTVTPSSGTGLHSGDSTPVTFHLARPAATDGIASIAISTPDGQRVLFTVRWLHTPGTLSIGPAYQDFGSYGSSVRFKVTVTGGANTWTVMNALRCTLSPTCLLSVTPARGSGSGTLTVNLYLHRGSAGKATITLQTADGQRQSVTVYWNVYGEPG